MRRARGWGAWRRAVAAGEPKEEAGLMGVRSVPRDGARHHAPAAPEDGRAGGVAPAVQAVGVTKRFPVGGGYRQLLTFWRRTFKTALRGVDLRVERGEVFGLLGPNGAGKTTLLKVLATLVLPNEGRALVHGYDVVRQGAQAKALVGYVVADERSFYWRLTGRQNLRFFGVLNNLPRRALEARIAELAGLLDLETALDTRVLAYSTGMRQRLAIARGLLADPAVLLLDEPTRSLDPVMAARLRGFLREELAQRRGKTVLVATHSLEEVQQGRVVACGPRRTLLDGLAPGRQVRVHVEGMPPLLLSTLARLPGVERVSADGQGEGDGSTALDVTLADPRRDTPGVLEAIIRAGGRVTFCGPREVSLGDLLRHLLAEA